MKCSVHAGLVALALYAVASPACGIEFRTVALTGQAAPGAPVGSTFARELGGASINDAGETVFYARLGPSGPVGLWSEGGGALHKVALPGELAPGLLAQRAFENVQLPRISNSGGAAFFGWSSMAQTNEGGFNAAVTFIFTEQLGTPQFVAAGSHALPEVPPGLLLLSVYPGFAQNSLNELAFVGALRDPAPLGETTYGLWTTRGGATHLVGRVQLPAARVAMNDAGRIVFEGTGLGDGSPGLWTDVSGTLQTFAGSGLAASGQPAGVMYTQARYPNINNAGHLAFSATLSGPGVDASNDGVLYAGPLGDFRAVSREGSQAPGATPGTVFSRFLESPMLNGAGRVAFLAQVTGPDVTTANDTGLWREGTGGLELVMREGQQAPGMPSGVVFGNLQSYSPAPSFNALGQVAFKAPLSGPGITVANDEGIWATDLNGQLRLIVRQGDMFDVNDDPLVTDLRRAILTPTTLMYGYAGGEGGKGTYFNNSGELVFSLEVGRLASGVFVASTAVPEPASVALLAGLAGMLTLFGRGRRGAGDLGRMRMRQIGRVLANDAPFCVFRGILPCKLRQLKKS